MFRVIERADIYKAKLHRIEVYSKIMNIEKSFAFHIYLENEMEAEKDLWNKVYETTLGENYKEQYPIRHKRLERAYYIDKDGKLKNIKYETSNKQFYLYSQGSRYK